MAATCLEHFQGEYIVHVGEMIFTGTLLAPPVAPFGRTSSADFQVSLAESFHCVLMARLSLTYPISSDCISVWKRTKYVKSRESSRPANPSTSEKVEKKSKSDVPPPAPTSSDISSAVEFMSVADLAKLREAALDLQYQEDEEGFWAPLSAFLPVAERHQLGVQLDQWVIRMLFERLAASPDLGVRLAFCTIHLSADSLADAALIDFVADSINRNPQVPVGKLCFMLRNDTVTDHPQQAMRCLESLRALGCRTAIDHRNGRQIAYIDLLRKLPVSLLRLDARSFARIVDDQVEQTLAETAIRLARLNGSRTLITEIDSEAQATVWRRLGADYLQGSAIARPSPVPFKA